MPIRRSHAAALMPALALALALAPALAHAQLVPVAIAKPARHTVAIAALYAQPLGEFGQNVKRGFGLDGAATYGIDARGIFGLRAQLGYIQYNSRSQPFYANTGFGLAELESSTKSGVLTLGVGPHIMAPEGALRPYVGGTVGFARFATETSIDVPARVSNTGSTQTLDSRTISSDFLLSLAGSAGLAFALPFFGNSGALADLGVRYHHNGLARYVSSEGVVYRSGSVTPTVTATESEANFLVYRVGVVIPLR
jgi:hypothetical protein